MEASGDAAKSASSGATVKRNPTDFLKQVIGKPVVVQLNSGVTYRGILACLDGFMNIAMEQTEEYVDGQLKARYGDCFLRGNNGKSFPSDIFFKFFFYSFIHTYFHYFIYDSALH